MDPVHSITIFNNVTHEMASWDAIKHLQSCLEKGDGLTGMCDHAGVFAMAAGIFPFLLAIFTIQIAWAQQAMVRICIYLVISVVRTSLRYFQNLCVCTSMDRPYAGSSKLTIATR